MKAAAYVARASLAALFTLLVAAPLHAVPPPSDTIPPQISGHSDVSAYATSADGAVVTFTAPTATDNVDGPVPVVCTPASGSVFPPGLTVVTCTATDAAKNVGTSTFNVIVSRRAPTVSVDGASGGGTTTTIYDFNGNSGGMPVVWAALTGVADPNGSVIESGGAVTITDPPSNGPELIQSAGLGGVTAVTTTVNILSMGGYTGATPQAITGIGGLADAVLVVQFSMSSNTFNAFVFGPGGQSAFTLPAGPHVPGYAGGPLSYTVAAGPTSFHVICGSFDSGAITYASAGLTGLTAISGFGSSPTVLFGTSAYGNRGGETIVWDSLSVTKTAVGSGGSTAGEGSPATKSGLFADPDGNSTVTLTASAGTITQDNTAGTWSWTATGADGPATQTITITATDNTAATATATFDFTVTNVAPSVTIGAPSSSGANTAVSYTFTATDPSSADQAAGFAWSLNYGDGVTESVPAGTASPLARAHTFANPGNYTVTATATDKDGGVSTAASQGITISGSTIPQTIAFGPLGGKTFGDANFTVSATGGQSGQPVTFTATGAATVSGNTVTITGAGNVTITAHQAGAGNYTAAADVSQSFTVAQASQTISFGPLSGKTFGNAAFTVSATGGQSGQPVTFTATGAATVSGNTVTITGAGNVTITAHQAGTANYAAAADVSQSFSVAQASQTISFGPLGGKTFGDAAFTISATGGLSGQAVTFTATGAATVSGNTVTITGAGNVTITAHQAGAANYSAAADVSQSFTVAQAAQTIAFALPSTALTTDAITLSATGGASNNAVAFSVFSGPGSITGQSLTFTGAGSVMVRASQAGNANYAAAAPVDQTIVVSNPVSTAGALAFASATPSARPVNTDGLPNLVHVQILRTGGSTGAVSATVVPSLAATANGLAKYVYGTDYQFVSGTSAGTTVSFAEGQTSATVDIQLETPATAKAGRFVLTLGTPLGGAALGGVKVATVTITARDNNKPVITLTSPATSTISTTNGGRFDLVGTVADNDALSAFTVTLNGVAVPLSPDPTTAFPSASPVSFSKLGIQAENGSNTLLVTAVDASGNTTTVSKLLTFANNRTQLAGNYTALLEPTDTPSVDTAGMITLTVTSAGVFSGKANLSGVSVSFSGILGNGGAARFYPALGATFPLIDRSDVPTYLGALSFSVSAEDGISGSLITGPGGDVLASIHGVQTPYSLKNPAPSTAVGVYGVAFPAKDQASALPSSAYPQGDGYMRMAVASNGNVSFNGKLADGLVLMASGRLGVNGKVILYEQLYRRAGAFCGELTLDEATDSDATGADLLWLRPHMARAQYYPNGWSSGIRVDAIGAKFSASTAFNFNQGSMDSKFGNAQVTFSDGLLAGAGEIDEAVNVTSGGQVHLLPPGDRRFTLAFDYTRFKITQTGAFHGNFSHSDGTITAYSGILLCKGATRRGYGFFLSTPPVNVYGGVGESGNVSLQAKSAR